MNAQDFVDSIYTTAKLMGYECFKEQNRYEFYWSNDTINLELRTYPHYDDFKAHVVDQKSMTYIKLYTAGEAQEKREEIMKQVMSWLVWS